MRHSMKVLAAKDTIFRAGAMSDEDIAEAERQNAEAKAWLDEQTRMTGGKYEHPEATLYAERMRQEREQTPTVRERHWEDDLLPDEGDADEDLADFYGQPPNNTRTSDHLHVLNNGFHFNGHLRYPKYERAISRNIRDSDGRPAWGNEGHVIERNTHVTEPANETMETDPLAYPWMHTYFPAGVDDEHGLVAGFNTPQAATRASALLAYWGTRHPDSQDLLRNYYQYVGNHEPYDPTTELPHEAAERENRA